MKTDLARLSDISFVNRFINECCLLEDFWSLAGGGSCPTAPSLGNLLASEGASDRLQNILITNNSVSRTRTG